MWWFGKSKQPENFEGLSPPWDAERKSIYAHLKEHLAPDKLELGEDGYILPDEKDDGELKWVAGGFDGAFGHHCSAGESQDSANSAFALLNKILRKKDAKALNEFYALLLSESALDYIDPFLERVAERNLVDEPALYAFSKWLVKNVPDREPLKFAIALLGVCATDDDKSLFLEIGTHEEFTLYCAVALSHSADEPEEELWHLAQAVHGWGRIQVVERLSETTNPRIKAWFCREGYDNSIMYEYTALICAESGDLISELSVDEPDEALLLGAAEILVALVNGAPGPGIEEYPDGPSAVLSLLRHLSCRDLSIRQFLNVRRLKDGYLTDMVGRDQPASETSALGVHALQLADQILGRPDWRDKVQAELDRQDASTFHFAREAAQTLGIDTWELLFQRLKAGHQEWYYVMQTGDESRIDRVIEYAEATLPLDEIGSGIGNELGLGADYLPHRNLDWIVQELEHWPGRGLRLIQAGLRSPVVRNRNMSLRALQSWGRAHWWDTAEAELQRLISVEPNESTRELITDVLATR